MASPPHLGDRLSVVVNTGDDCERHGLLVMPDHDTVLYNLAGIEQVEWGWGIEGDTHATMAQLVEYGEEGWFSLGDRDLALHIARTARVRAGGRLTTVCLGLQALARRPLADPADGRRAGADRGARRRGLARVPGVLRAPAPGARRARDPVRGGRGVAAHARGRRGAGSRRGDRDLPVEPARVGRADPRRAGDARGHRGGARARRPGGGREPDHRRARAQGARRPDARVAGPRGDRARRRPALRGPVPTCSCSTGSTRTSPATSRPSGSARSSPTRS